MRKAVHVSSLAALLALLACGDAPPEVRALTATERAALSSAFTRSLADSTALARSSFDYPVKLETSFGEDDTSVSVIETFRLTKRPGAEFAAVDRKQRIEGDRSLLASMYSFENSKGDLREENEARFANIGFGADQRSILRDLLSGQLGLEGNIVDSTAGDGLSTRIVRFGGDGISGSIELDKASSSARSVSMTRANSTIVGGYMYTMRLVLTRPDDSLRIPLDMRTDFTFERLTTSGSGTVRMTIDTTRR